MNDELLVRREGGVAVISLNRPAQYNALTAGVLFGLQDAFATLERDDDVRAIVLTGTGKGFCSGQSLDDPSLAGPGGELEIFRAVAERYNPLLHAMLTIEKPVVAAINGVAAGAGMGLALACDLRLASRSASFTTAFVRIGLVPDSGVSFLLPYVVGYGRAMEAILLSPKIDAQRAYEIGLVNRLCDEATLLDEARATAAELARGPRALGLAKRELVRTLGDVRAALDYEARVQAIAAASEDFARGIAAFREKRTPAFEGR